MNRHVTPQYITIARAAEILSVSTDFVEGQIRQGNLPCYRLGTRMRRVREADVLALAKAAPPIPWVNPYKP